MLDLDFGKYGAFIWAAYGISALVLTALTVTSLQFSAHWRRKAEQLKAEEDAKP